MCSWHVCFTLILKKTGSCSGRVLSLLFLLHFKKKSGACSGRVQCVPVTFKFPKKGENKGCIHRIALVIEFAKTILKSRLEAYVVHKHTQKPDLPISNTH